MRIKKKIQPQNTIDDYTAKKILRMTDKFYSDPKNQEAFEKWRKEQYKSEKK